jgi:hypothetical protein
MEVIYGIVWYINRILSYINKKYRIYDYCTFKTILLLDYVSRSHKLIIESKQNVFNKYLLS